MTNSINRYSEMTDSEVEWLGDVPAHWEIGRLKSRVSEIVDLASHRRASELYIALEHVEGWTGRIICTDYDTAFESQVKSFQPGDVLFGKLRPNLAKVTFPDRTGVCVGEFLVLRSRNGDPLPSYLAFLLRSRIAIDVISASTYGAKMPRTNWHSIGNLNFPFPPIDEQAAIVRFLEHADRNIRLSICMREKLIERLNEHKCVLIHQATTGQVDVRTSEPYPAYKQSVIEWLERVPSHWNVTAVKRQYAIQLGKMLQNKPLEPSDLELPYLKAQHVQWFFVRTADAPRMWASQNDRERFGISQGDLLVCEGGEGGRAAVLDENIVGYIIQNALHRVRSRDPKQCLNNFLLYMLKAHANIGWLNILSDKATIAHFTKEKFRTLNITIPPISEQKSIVRFLDNACQRIQLYICVKEKEINLLREWRARLISDAVTGKIDVSRAEMQPPVRIRSSELLDKVTAQSNYSDCLADNGEGGSR